MKLQKIVSRLQELRPNGKYSTIQAIFSILKEANFNCNIYTSPHIKSINERFVFNNEELNDEDLANLLEEVEEANNGEPITFFEILTAAYFLKVDYYSDLTLLIS